MVHRKLKQKFKLTDEHLRAIFTEKDPTSERGKLRRKIEDRVSSRIEDGIKRSLANAALWQSVDIAWDGQGIQKQTIPLLLWAQGKIKLDTLADRLKGLGLADQYIKRAPDNTLKVDIPRLFEVSINLIRSYITRRLASQSARFSNLWPYFRYEPRGTDEVAKLRGDATSQRMEIMSDAYNYRHFFNQADRAKFLYGRSVVFPRCGWDVKTAWRPKDLNLESDDIEVESYVEREGVDFVCPHPSRVGWDNASPLANINTDTGPKWIFHWDIIRYGELLDGPYYNLDAVSTGEAMADFVRKHGDYFNYYFDPKVLEFPELKYDPSAANDRHAHIGRYSAEEKDKGCYVTNYFECINPKLEGISELNMDVWMRYAVAGDKTIIGAEAMPSRAACYGGFNENDDREANPSMAVELMPHQDTLSNLYSQMLMTLRNGIMQIWAIDKDAFDPEMQEYIRKELKAGSIYTEPKAFFYSGAHLRNNGLPTPGDQRAINIIQANLQASLEQIYNAIVRTLNIADRIMILSPNELGQPNPREVAAREVTEISTSTAAIHSFVSDGIDEQRAAVKRMIFEAYVCCSTEPLRVPVIGRYLLKTVRKAGFHVDTGDEAVEDENAVLPIKSYVVGRASDVMYDYYFDSRDGAERSVNSDGAKILGTLLGQMLQSEAMVQMVGKRRIFEIWNEIFRLSGAAYDLKLEIDDGENEAAPTPGEAGGVEERIARLEGVLKQLIQQLGLAQPPGPPGEAPPQAGGVPPPPPSPGESPAALMEPESAAA